MDLLSSKELELKLVTVKENKETLNKGLTIFMDELRKENQNNYFTYDPTKDNCVKKINKILTKIGDEINTLELEIADKNYKPTFFSLNTQNQNQNEANAKSRQPSYMSHISRNEGSRKEGGKSCRKYSKKQRKTRIKKRRSLSR